MGRGIRARVVGQRYERGVPGEAEVSVSRGMSIATDEGLYRQGFGHHFAALGDYIQLGGCSGADDLFRAF